jgi:hypothetical protein
MKSGVESRSGQVEISAVVSPTTGGPFPESVLHVKSVSRTRLTTRPLSPAILVLAARRKPSGDSLKPPPCRRYSTASCRFLVVLVHGLSQFRALNILSPLAPFRGEGPGVRGLRLPPLTPCSLRCSAFILTERRKPSGDARRIGTPIDHILIPTLKTFAYIRG